MKESRVDRTHVDVTTEDGSRTYRYEIGVFGDRWLQQVTDNLPDGTSKTYEPAGVVALLSGDPRGAEKK